MPLDVHPGTLCWCGHPIASHANMRRDKVGRCRQHLCPCRHWTQDGEPLPVSMLNDLLIGMTITVQFVGFRAHGTLEQLEQDGAMTFIRIRNDSGDVFQASVRSDLPALISVEMGGIAE